MKGRRGRAGIAALAAAVAIVPIAVPGSAAAQDGFRVAPGVAFESYQFGDAEIAGLRSIRLVSTPLAASLRAGRLRVQLRGAFARGTVEDSNGEQAALGGLTDTELRVDVDVVPDQFTLTARGIAPTGPTELGAGELLVASVVASDLLPFRISNWGGGGGLALGAVASRRFGAVGLGASVDWRRSGEFDPVAEAAGGYRPGDQIALHVALNGDLARGVRGSVRLGFRSFGDDTLEGVGLFQSGRRIEAIANVGFPTRFGGSAAVYGGFVHRDVGQYLVGTSTEAPSQDLLIAGGVWRIRTGRGWVQPRTDVRLFRSEDGVGQGYQVGVGASAEFGAGGAMTLVPTLMGRLGQVEVSEGLSSGFTGFEVGLSVRFAR